MVAFTREAAMSRSLEYELSVGQPGFAVPNFSARWLAVFLILSLWAMTVLGTLLSPVPIVCFVLLLAQKRWRLLTLCAAMSPMGVGFALGVISYCTGTAKVQGMGLPGPGYFNVDPELRCERSTGGCLVNGGEILTQMPNNWVVMGLTRLFGPQPGAYTGPYPDETQAMAALSASGAPISVELLAQDQVDVAQPPVKLDVGVGSGLLRPTMFTFVGRKLDADSRNLMKEIGSPTATLYQGQCLILRIPMNPRSAMIVLLDIQRGRPFAYYADGEFFQRIPPVMWGK
jgi:hypothetical protein